MEYIHKIGVFQRGMECAMLYISLVDVGMRIATLKWRRVGYIARRDDNRWTKATTEWDPVGAKSPRGRQPPKWSHDIVDVASRL